VSPAGVRRARLASMAGSGLLLVMSFSGATSAQVSSAPGDPAIGRALFLGARRFENGAPSCRACHSVAGVGALGGGALGPDLTGSNGKFGSQGLATILAAMPFPTMNPVFSSRPLTAQEQAHVLVFLEQVAAQRPTPVVARIAGLVLGLGVVLLGLTHLVWRGRLGGVRRTLVGGGRASRRA